MYESFFGLSERPFDLTPNPRFLVLTTSHREGLCNLEYAIGSRKGVMLLTGDAGSGKTTLIRTAIERHQSGVHCVHIHNPALTRTEFVETLAGKFALSERAYGSKGILLLELEALLAKRQATGETTVLIIDEAQSLSLELLEELRLLVNMEANNEKLLSLIIAGQPEVLVKLERPEIRQLKQRIALRCELHPLTLAETATYVAQRIDVAGGVAARIFTRDAVMLVHQEAKGIPRIINVLADNALVGGFAINEKPVTTTLVREVCRDFWIGSESAAGSGLLTPAVPLQRAGRVQHEAQASVEATSPARTERDDAALLLVDDAGRTFGSRTGNRGRSSAFFPLRPGAANDPDRY